MTAPEILAPVGGQEQLLAAVRCGADAVYLGGKRFNARRNAANFEEATLAETVAYCHARDVKVYVTVNTLVTDAELPLLEEEADCIAAAGADAVILQDMAALRLFRSRYPALPRYASTQTAVHNVDGARFLQDMGFDSIVLARELSLDEMARITAAVPLKTEAFVHGAHCMSVSGACYLSSMLGGRSGNRGLCAQPCRLDWTCGGRSFALSLKDMSLVGHIRRMADAGVDALKIEGRMKRPEYVAAAVTACRQARAGEAYDVATLEAVFSRSGFSDGYLTGKRDRAMFGARTREDVTGAAGVLSSLAALYRAETPRVAVDMTLSVTGDASRLSVSDGQTTVSVTGDAPQRAERRALDAETAGRSLEKTGGTPFYLRDLQTNICEGLMLPAAALNALRRDALDRLLAARARPCVYEKQAHRIAPPGRYTPAAAPALWARFPAPEAVVCADAFDRILLPAQTVTPAVIDAYGDRLAAQLPTLLFPADEDAFSRMLTSLRDAGLTRVYAENIYGIPLARRLGLTVHGGMLLNALNTEALRAYADAGLDSVTLSFECAMGKARALGGRIPRGLAVYGYLPLMHLRNCPVRAGVGCADCDGQGRLTDRRGVAFPVECANKRYATLLNSVPLDVGDRDLSAFDYRLLYFTIESRQEAEAVVRAQLARQKPAGTHTTGLYFRELL